MKSKNFCGIFATLFVTTTIILLTSCSQDDDYYENSEMYTLAEMGTRSGGGDPGGQPDPVITYVPEDSLIEDHEFYFFPNNVFNSLGFQNNPFVAIDPSLYGGLYVEVDIHVKSQRVDNTPTVTSFICSPSVISLVHILDSICGYNYDPTYDPGFTVTDVYFQPDNVPVDGRYLLYATGIYTTYSGEDIYCTGFIPNRIYN